MRSSQTQDKNTIRSMHQSQKENKHIQKGLRSSNKNDSVKISVDIPNKCTDGCFGSKDPFAHVAGM